jgi:hypothetical protein
MASILCAEMVSILFSLFFTHEPLRDLTLGGHDIQHHHLLGLRLSGDSMSTILPT